MIGAIPQLIEAGVKLFISLIANLPTIIVEIVKAIPQIIKGIIDAFGSYFGNMAEVGGNLLKGLWQGISDAGAWQWNQISGFFGGIVDGIKNFFGIHSPSKLFANLGGFIAEGLGEGFGDEMKAVSKEMQNAIPSDFDLDMNGTVSGRRRLLMLQFRLPLTELRSQRWFPLYCSYLLTKGSPQANHPLIRLMRLLCLPILTSKQKKC